MSVLPMRIIGDPILRTTCRDVDRFDGALELFAASLAEAMDHYKGVGVAANQLGSDQRVFAYDDDGELRWLCNPTLSGFEGEVRSEEGCLSIPGLFFDTTRAERVTVHGVDLAGQPVTFQAEGFLARIMQHETDHLNGKLYIDRLDEDIRREAMRQIREKDIRP